MRIAAAALLCTAVVSCAEAERPNRASPPQPMQTLEVSATAFCVEGTTKSGEQTRRGIIAADPTVLPLGSRVRIAGLGERYNGEYRVSDTGRGIKGREVDIFIADCGAAKRFGRQTAQVSVLRRGPAAGRE